jgi:hypothetical protein
MAASDLYQKLYNQTQVQLAKKLDATEMEIAKRYGEVLVSCRRKLERFYEKYAQQDGVLSNADKTTVARLSALQDSIEEILKKKIPTINTYTKKLTGEMYEESFFRHAYAIDQSGGMSLSWGLVPEHAVEAAVKGAYDTFAKSRNLAIAQAKAVRQIRQEISLAMTRGDSYEKLAARIGKAIGCNVVNGKVRYGRCGAAAWSMEVARTEGQRVLVEGQSAAYEKAKDLGCQIEEVWDATLDARTRPEHATLDGKAKDDPDKGWMVESLGSYVSAPLHSGVASFDINCRCRIRAQVVGFPPDQRYVRGDGVKPYQTYKQWAASKKRS